MSGISGPRRAATEDAELIDHETDGAEQAGVAALDAHEPPRVRWFTLDDAPDTTAEAFPNMETDACRHSVAVEREFQRAGRQLRESLDALEQVDSMLASGLRSR